MGRAAAQRAAYVRALTASHSASKPLVRLGAVAMPARGEALRGVALRALTTRRCPRSDERQGGPDRALPHVLARLSLTLPDCVQSPRKTTMLKQMLQSRQLEFIMEAHNGLSAKIVQEAGFKGIWGSGLSISAQLGVRDSNEASWTQVLEVLEFMAEATHIPILLDGDTVRARRADERTVRRSL